MNIAIRIPSGIVARAIASILFIISITSWIIILARSEPPPARIVRPGSPCETSAPDIDPPFAKAVLSAEAETNPQPPYPTISKALGEEGTVILRVHVLSDGKADQVDIKQSSGSARLDESARATISKWRFTPARQGSEAVASWILVPVSFKLISTEKQLEKRSQRIDSPKNQTRPFRRAVESIRRHIKQRHTPHQLKQERQISPVGVVILPAT